MSAARPTEVGTWVLLRGLTRERGHWGRFVERLQARLPGARIVALDLPGNGRLNHEASPTTIEATMAHCRSQLRAMAIAPPYHLLAMSLGAMVAVDWAVHHPRELERCVLINTSLRPFSPWYRRLRPANYGALLGLAFGGRTDRQREETVLRLTSRHADRSVVDEWVGLRAARPVSSANALRQLVAAARYRAPAQPPAVPLLVVYGEHDALVDSRCSQRLAQAWQAQSVAHPSAGHDLPLDDGEWLAEQVGRWCVSAP